MISEFYFRIVQLLLSNQIIDSSGFVSRLMFVALRCALLCIALVHNEHSIWDSTYVIQSHRKPNDLDAPSDDFMSIKSIS